VATKEIMTSGEYTVCDVCGRTLLRGERSEVYLAGGERRSVCDLCKSRAIHEGWIREGTVAAYNSSGSGSDRRRGLFGRFRARPDGRGAPPSARPTLGDELDGQAWSESSDWSPEPVPASPRRRRPDRQGDSDRARDRQGDRDRGRDRGDRDRDLDHVREPRHVRAVPTSIEHKQASAIELFNRSEHKRTVAGVARSLGMPTVAVLPSPGHSSTVFLIASWELCWYRYEVDLSEDRPTVRVAAQGYELDELAAEERRMNASCDESGALELIDR
jgi:hypothetical protein